MSKFLTPKGFLMYGGIVLVVVGILSYLPFTNQTGSIFGAIWWFDGTEGVVHILLGVVAIAASYVLNADLAKWLTAVVGVVALLFAIYGLLLPQGAINTYNIGPANLESPMDSILHLVVAAWALYAAFMAKPAMMASPKM